MSDSKAALQQAQADNHLLRQKLVKLRQFYDCEPWQQLQQAQATIQRLEQHFAKRSVEWDRQTAVITQLLERVNRADEQLAAAQATIPHLQALVKSGDLKRVLDAAQQHANDEQAWRSVWGPAYFESNLGRCENRRKLRVAIQELAALLSAIPALQVTQEHDKELN